MNEMIIRDKRIYIVENHQDVLPIWYDESINSEEIFELVTFDYHADTVIPFRAYVVKKAYEEKLLTESIFDGIISDLKQGIDKKKLLWYSSLLECDEHILFARFIKIISHISVIYCMRDVNENDGVNYYRNKRNSCKGFEEPTKNCKKYCEAMDIFYCHNRLSDKYIQDSKFSFPTGKFILDFDLDYFQSIKSFNVDCTSIIRRLINEAQIITIARSKEYFNMLKCDEDFRVEDAEKFLLDFINEQLRM